MKHAITHTVTLAAVSGVLHQQNLRTRLAVFAHDLRRIVARSVVHYQNFRIPVLLFCIAKKLIERGPDAYAFVVGGNDKTVGQEAIRGFWRAAPRGGDYATCRRLSSMPKNSDTNSSSQSPLRASASMVTAACSWLRAGL